jgi:hypothetical protein
MKRKFTFVDYHGRRSGIIKVLAKVVSEREKLGYEFFSGGLPANLAPKTSYRGEDQHTVGSRYAAGFQGTELDDGTLVERIRTTPVGPYDRNKLDESELIFALTPDVLQGLKTARIPEEKLKLLMIYLDLNGSWMGSPDYSSERALVEKGKEKPKKIYMYESPLSGKKAQEGSDEAFKLHAQDLTDITNRLCAKLFLGG